MHSPKKSLSTLRVLSVALALSLVGAFAAVADFRLEKELALAPGGELVVKTEGGAVVVEGASRTGVSVVVTSHKDNIDDYFEFSFEEEPGRVTIQAKKRGRGISRWFGWSSAPHFEIEVPSNTRVDLRTSGGSIHVEDILGEVEAHTSGGAVRASDLGGSARLSTSGGSIGAERIVGDLYADTSGGAIRIEDVGGDVAAETSGGSVSIEGVGGRVEASSSGGPVTAYFAPGNFSGGSLSTSGGRVTAYVDRAAKLDIDISTSGGRAVVDIPITTQGRMSRNAVRGTINGGGPLLRLRSSGGGVSVKPL